MDRTADFLQMWLKLHKSSLAFWIMVVPLVSNQQPSRFLTSPTFSGRRKLNNNLSVKVWARNVTLELCRSSKMQEHWFFCCFVFDMLGKAIDNFGCERSWLRCINLLWCSGLRNTLYFILTSLSLSYFIMTLFSWL